jgi:hypothetical protein
MSSRVARPALLVALGLSLLALESASAGLAQSVPSLASPPPAAVSAAIATPLTRHHRDIPGGAHINNGHRDVAPLILAAAAFAGNPSADERLLEQMRYSLIGGNDITANGGYPAQHDRHLTAMYAVAKLTPRVWNRLSERERHAVDLVMTASFVSNAFTTSDQNPFVLAGSQQYALDGDDNLNRDWNPNYREGMVGGVLVGMVYFGGPERAQAVLDSFDHAAFVADVARAGLSNVHETFTWKASHPESHAPAGEAIERAIRGYRYRGMSLRDYMAIYHALTADTYGRAVSCGLEGGQGIRLPDGSRAGMLLTGCDGLPNRGKPGMLKELDAVDAGGPRSSTIYAYSGFRVNLVNQYVLVAGGYWQPNELARQSLSLIEVGVPDLWYKLDHGYSNYAKAARQGELRGTSTAYGFEMTRPLWEEVLRPYHRRSLSGSQLIRRPANGASRTPGGVRSRVAGSRTRSGPG